MGHSFPELDWILDEGKNTIIFCKTIALSFRIVCYLWSKAAQLPNHDKWIHLYNSLNWPTYSSETLGFLNNNKESLITMATNTLSVGWDSQFTWNAVLIGEPNDIDEFLQTIGCIGWNRKAVPNPHAFLYHSQSAIATAQQLVDGPRKGAAWSDPAMTMDISMARVLVAECLMSAVDEPYENPANDPPCFCSTCQANLPVTWRQPAPKWLSPASPWNLFKVCTVSSQGGASIRRAFSLSASPFGRRWCGCWSCKIGRR